MMAKETDCNVSHLLQLLQLDGSTENNEEVFISKENLLNVSRDLNVSSEELDIIFSALDTDNDGLIKASDLYLGLSRANGGSQISEFGNTSGFTSVMVPPEVELLCSDRQEQVCELYQKLHASEHPELLDQFESIILGVIRDIRQCQIENERLEKSYKRDKDQHERHLRQLEDEMEVQMQKTEERIREQEQHKAEAAKAEIQEQVESEVSMLKQNLQKLQQEGVGTWSKEQEEQLTSLKNKLEQITYDNRQLKSDLTDAKTNLALVRSECATIKQQFKESSHELDRERETVVDYIKEQDSLTRQLHLLHEANKRLHDANDDLREALDTERESPRRHSSTGVRMNNYYSQTWAPSHVSSRSRERKGSILSDYIQSGPPSLRPASPTMSMTSSMMDDPFMPVSMPRLDRMPSPRLIKAHPLNSRGSFDDDKDSVLEDMDSGHSTLRDLNEPDVEAESHHINEEDIRRNFNRRNRHLKTGYIEEEEEPDSHDEMETETESHLDLDPTHASMYHILEKRRLGSVGSRSSSRSSRSIPRDGRDSPNNSRSNRRHAGTLGHEIVSKKSSNTPERMFKIVLAGDAAVGKSSFIMRLCKGKFVSNISSTLGVDFQTKVIESDGHSVALQLWDTAGQERFRSIAKSYFRRADGVLLLYDCTYERSFLSVREWVESIEEGAQKKIPIMVCANKTDLRQESEQQGRRVVHFTDGQRLAREFEALFIETSAKDGSNIAEAVIDLTRLLRANEDLEVKTVGLQLHDSKKSETKSSCCR